MLLDRGGISDILFGGWELSSIVQWTSGSPVTFVDNRGTVNRTGRSGRQTPQTTLTREDLRALGGVFEQNGTFYFLDPTALSTAFTPNAPGQTGNTPRAVINSPKFFNIDMALLKNIRFSEAMRVQLRAEAFNVLNNVNFQPPVAGQLQLITATNFGQLTGTAPARTLQFAARFEF